MKLPFTKMQGTGNDFVVLDGVSRRIELTPERVRRIADRHFGIGCDQVLLVERPTMNENGAAADFRYRIFNADGGEVEQCGNGARCFARFVRDRGLTSQSEIRVETLAGIIAPRLEANGEVTVDMGAPVFELARVPFDARGLEMGSTAGNVAANANGREIWAVQAGDAMAQLSVLSMGNPHAVQVVADADQAPVTTQGPLIEHHARFAQRVNAGYMQVLDRHHVKLRVWERGAGETLACGTGACAAAVAGMRRGLLDSPVRVSMRGGDLTIAWSGGDNERTNNNTASVRMTGPAVTVFQGEISFDE